MASIRTLTLATRLALGFGTMMLLIALIVGIGVNRLSLQQRALESVTEHAYPKVEASQTIAYTVLDIARVARNMILLTDKPAEAKNLAVYEKDRATIDAKLAILDRLVETDAGRAALAEVKSTGAAYIAFTQEVLEAEKNDAAAATVLLFGPKYASQAAYLAALDDLVTLEKTSMRAASAEAAAAYVDAVRTMIAALVAAVAAGGAFAFLITRSITRPMDEAVRIASAVADGDLTSRITADATDEVGQLVRVLMKMNASLASMVGAVRDSSESIATGSAEIATGNADLSQRTEEQASNLQQTAASMEQMRSNVQQTADTARTAAQLAASASSVAMQGGEVVARVVSTMDHISASSRRIADIVGVIDGIAFQTNILALNAAVEAARAGEQGRGFAVVAGEVRSLAQRSAESAREIKTLISESVEAVESGTRLVGGAGSTMTDIVSQVRRVADLIGEMNAATQEQTTGIGQVSESVTQLDRVTQQNAALVEQSAAAADSLKQQAMKMAELVSVFKLETPPPASTVAAAVAVAPRSFAPKPAAPAVRAASPAKAPPAGAGRPAAVTVAASEPDWESF